MKIFIHSILYGKISQIVTFSNINFYQVQTINENFLLPQQASENWFCIKICGSSSIWSGFCIFTPLILNAPSFIFLAPPGRIFSANSPTVCIEFLGISTVEALPKSPLIVSGSKSSRSWKEPINLGMLILWWMTYSIPLNSRSEHFMAICKPSSPWTSWVNSFANSFCAIHFPRFCRCSLIILLISSSGLNENWSSKFSAMSS